MAARTRAREFPKSYSALAQLKRKVTGGWGLPIVPWRATDVVLNVRDALGAGGALGLARIAML